MEEISSVLRKLTYDDLREWAGSKIFSRGKSYIRNVDGLSRMEDGTLAAWVSGSEEYATSVRLDPGGDIEYFCTCPYDWGPCKHAVAVVLAAAEQVKLKKEIPLLKEKDDLFLALFDDSDDGYEDDDEYEDDGEWADEDEETEYTEKPASGKTKGKAKVRKILEGMDKEALISVLIDLTARYPEIERGLLEKEQLAAGRVDKVVSSLRREIRDLTAESAWYNPWKGEGNLPDYSHVREQLQALFDKGHANAVLQLGEELWTRGQEQVGQSDDDSETATAIAECMEVVLKAVTQSSLAPSEQLLWVIDHMLVDEYSLLESGGEILENKSYTKEHWRQLTDSLEARLESFPKSTSTGFTHRYRRSGLMNMLLDAYSRSGRPDRIIPVLEKEADACMGYGKLADALLAAGEKEKARQWLIHGFDRTIADAPGIASGLQGRLREMAEKEKRHDLAAAYRAQDFFESASRKTYTDLKKSAEKAKVWPLVRESVLRYLETGKRPDADDGGKKAAAWPLPAPEVMRPRNAKERHGQRFPDQNMLIDIAILEKRFDDVVALYQELRKTKRWGWETDKAVAVAVAETHPQAALDIWKFIVDGLIAQVKPKAYEEAAGYLRRMYKVYQATKGLADWQSLLGELRKQHKAKRRLMEVLDGLSGKKLTD